MILADVSKELKQAGFTPEEIKGITLNIDFEKVDDYDLKIHRNISTSMELTFDFGPKEEIEIKGSFLALHIWGPDRTQESKVVARRTDTLELKLELFRINRRRNVLIQKFNTKGQ